MGGWLEAQIKEARTKRRDLIDPTKVRNTIEMTEKALQELQESDAIASKFILPAF